MPNDVNSMKQLIVVISRPAVVRDWNLQGTVFHYLHNTYMISFFVSCEDANETISILLFQVTYYG